MRARLIFLAALFLVTAALMVRVTRPEVVPLREPLATLPMSLGSWTGRDEPALARAIVDVLGVDEYLMRTYVQASEPPVWLYLGYYRSQREGDTIHSPMNCLPGAGWQPTASSRATIDVPGRASPIEVNHIVIQKGLERQSVFYWYQSQGRVVASEYWSKAYLVYDALRTNRSDAALVRVITPMLPAERTSDAAARRLSAFVQAIFPALTTHLPS
jgi:EpsI family protein